MAQVELLLRERSPPALRTGRRDVRRPDDPLAERRDRDDRTRRGRSARRHSRRGGNSAQAEVRKNDAVPQNPAPSGCSSRRHAGGRQLRACVARARRRPRHRDRRRAVEGRISPLLYGQFLEFMFEGIKGGLHAELMREPRLRGSAQRHRPVAVTGSAIPTTATTTTRSLPLGRRTWRIRHAALGGNDRRALAARPAPARRDRAARRLSGARAGPAGHRLSRLPLAQDRLVQGRRRWRSKPMSTGGRIYAEAGSRTSTATGSSTRSR